jgi:hypothetical protein
MTTLSELCQDVYIHTNRPDLSSETQLALRTAARKFHLMDFWKRDYKERVLPLSAASTLFALDIPSNFENWRKFDYIRPWDQINSVPIGGEESKLSFLDPAAIFDEFGRTKTNVYYVSGSNLQIKTSQGYDAFVIGWYSYPNLGPNDFASWIADMYPELLVEEASGRILHIIGMVDEGNKFVDPVKGTVYNPITGHLQAFRANVL